MALKVGMQLVHSKSKERRFILCERVTRMGGVVVWEVTWGGGHRDTLGEQSLQMVLDDKTYYIEPRKQEVAKEWLS